MSAEVANNDTPPAFSSTTMDDLSRNRAIIRIVKHGIFSVTLIALYRDRIVVGKRSFFDKPLTDEMWSDDGELALRRILRTSRVAHFAEITSIQEQRPGRPLDLLGRRKVRGNFRLQINVTSQRPLRFPLPHGQSYHVRQHLLAAFPTEYITRDAPARAQSPGLGCMAAGLFLFGLLFCVAGCLGLASGTNNMVALGVMAFGASVTALSGYLLFQPAGKPKALDAQTLDLEYRESDPLMVKDQSRSQPLRSRVLGISIQICGLVYLLLSLSPLFDGFMTNNIQLNGLIIWAPTTLAIYLGYRVRQVPIPAFVSASPESLETKRLVLYLRPFEDDDSVTLRPAGFLSRATGLRSFSDGGRLNFKDIALSNYPIRLLRMLLNRDSITAEESVSRFLSQLAPPIAIGRPGQKLASVGASRIYVADEGWREQVLRLLERAEAVVIQPGRTPGVEWELEQIRAKVVPHRVLLCLAGYWRDPQGFEEATTVLHRTLGVELPPSLAYWRQPAFITFNAEWQPVAQPMSYHCPIYWPILSDGVNLKRTLGPFLTRLRSDHPDQDPLTTHQAKWAPGIARVAVAPFAIAVALFISLVPVLIGLVLYASFI